MHPRSVLLLRSEWTSKFAEKQAAYFLTRQGVAIYAASTAPDVRYRVQANALLVCKAEAVAVCPAWQFHKELRLYAALANAMNKPLVYAHNLERVERWESKLIVVEEDGACEHGPEAVIDRVAELWGTAAAQAVRYANNN